MKHPVESWSDNQQALLGLLGVALLVVAGTFGLRWAFGAYDAGYQLTATFDGAGQNLDTESTVKLRGVDVGRVRSITLGDDHRAVVRLHIDPGVEVPETTVAVIRPISVFGPKFVDLVPGAGEGEGPYLEDGDAVRRTSPAVELEDILGEAADLLEAVDESDVTTVLHTLARGVDGLGAEMAGSITHGRTVLAAMVASSGDRRALLTDLSLLADELADRGDTILGLADNARGSLPLLTRHEADLAGLLEATSRLSSGLADVVTANADVLGPGIDGGSRLAGVTAADLRGVVSYLDFVDTYGNVLSQVIRVPVAGQAFLAATQQFLLAADPCIALVDVPGCTAPAIDPGPAGAGR